MSVESASDPREGQSAGPLQGISFDSQEPVQTFTIDVSADQVPHAAPGREDLTQAATLDLSFSPENTLSDESLIVRRRQSARRSIFGSRFFRAITKRFHSHSSWLISLLLHLTVVIPISFWTIHKLEEPLELTLTSVSAYSADEVNLDEFSGEFLEGSQDIEGQFGSELTQADAAFTSDLDTQAGLGELSGGLLASDGLGAALVAGDGSPFGDPNGLFGARGNGLADMMPSGEQLTASFFGTKVQGRRILYVLDNSGGMRDGGLEALVDELLRSVNSLSGEQQFFVIFYSDMVYPLFHPRPVERFVPANNRFKKRLNTWLDSVEFCVGNTVDEAIHTAAMIGPDAVYLLTDGDVDTTPDGRKLAALQDSRGRDFPIHTFGIGMSEGSKAANNLKQVADANNGTFRIIDISAEAKQRARTKRRPYHNKEPGEVWGLNVGRGWGR